MPYCLIANGFHLVKKLFKGKSVRSGTVSLLIGLILLLSALAASPQLHKLVHADADCADHNCVVTLFAAGHFAAADTAVVVVGIALLFGAVALLTETFLLPVAEYRFSPSRAPPIAS
jgi:hypothetical protein